MQAAQHIAQQFSVLAVPTRRRGTSRFSLYLLEHGELFLYDFGGTLEGDDNTARGRLRCCSRSLVFEPADARGALALRVDAARLRPFDPDPRRDGVAAA